MKSNSQLKPSLFILLFLFLAGINTLSAQTSYSPKAGLHLASIDGKFKDSSEINSQLGWQIGLDIRKGNGLFFFNPGLFYRITTADVKKLINLQDPLKYINSTTTIQSIAIPVNIGFYLTGQDAGLIRIYIIGGVIPSYIVGMKSADKFNLNPTEFNRFQLGLNAGVGIDLLFLNIGASYQYYLQDYFKDKPGKNRMITLNIGFIF